jgi:hypothetical protein
VDETERRAEERAEELRRRERAFDSEQARIRRELRFWYFVLFLIFAASLLVALND